MSERYTLFPSVLPDGEAFVDDEYGREELERMDYTTLRQIAAEHESDDVNGRMSREELLAGLEGLTRV